MIQNLAKTAFLLTCGLSLAVTALAQCPPYYYGGGPVFISVVGYTSPGVPDPLGTFTVSVSDGSGLPCSSVPVEVDFQGCTDMELDATQPGVECGAKKVTALTDAFGVATFTITGSGRNRGGAPSALPRCVVIRVGAPPILASQATAVVFDQDGASVGGTPGVGLADARAVMIDYGLGFYFPRSDMNQDGETGLGDYRALCLVYGVGSSHFGPPGYCVD